VTFAGFRPDVHRALASFDAYAITSRSEGFSLATVQAMASGLPVVATRCGGPEEIVDHGATGILVPNGSPEAVADALFHLRNDAAARHSLGEQARRVAETRYTVAAQVRAYERVYEEALSPGASLRAAAAHSDVEAATCPR